MTRRLFPACAVAILAAGCWSDVYNTEPLPFGSDLPGRYREVAILTCPDYEEVALEVPCECPDYRGEMENSICRVDIQNERAPARTGQESNFGVRYGCPGEDGYHKFGIYVATPDARNPDTGAFILKPSNADNADPSFRGEGTYRIRPDGRLELRDIGIAPR